MNEPMSLFDWGIYKTEKKMDDLKVASSIFGVSYFSHSVSYNWTSNRIELRVLFVGTGTDSECIENVKKAKGAFLNFTWDDKEQRKVAADLFNSLFSHEGGYESKARPTDVGEQLANIAVVEASILVKSGSGYTPKARCRANFTNAEVVVVKQ